MALVLKDRVKEVTTTAGTGTITLAGASLGYQSFSVIGNGNTTYYCIAGRETAEWEVGIGTYTSAGTTLSRDTILASSNSGSIVTFSAGTKDVFVVYPAGKSVYQDSSGNVGIGTSSPGTKLDIVGTYRTLQNGSDTYGTGVSFYQGNAANNEAFAWQQSTAGSTLNLWAYSTSGGTGWTNRVSFTASGNVGIGTTSPSYKLHVQGDTNLTSVSLIKNTNSAVTALATLLFGNDANNSGKIEYTSSTFTGTPNALRYSGDSHIFYTISSAERMRIDSSGNVGIGTASPSVKLDVTGAISSTSNILASLAAATVGITNATYGSAYHTAVLSYPEVQVRPNPGYAGSISFTENTIADRWSIGIKPSDSNLYFFNVRNITSATAVLSINSRGYLGIASTPQTYAAIEYAETTAVSGGSLYGIEITPSLSAGTTTIEGVRSRVRASTGTHTSVIAVRAGLDGFAAGSTITTGYGVRVTKPSGAATTLYGVASEIDAASGYWNIYASGTALNYFAGKIGVGLTGPSAMVQTSTTDGTYLIAGSGTTKGFRVVTDANQTSIQGVDNTLTASYQPLTFSGSDLRFQSNGTTERMRIDSSGNVLVNQASAYSAYVGTSSGWTPKSQVSQISTTNVGFGIFSWSSYSAADTGGGIGIGADLILAHSNNNATGSHTAITNGMLCGRITFNGSNGTEFAPGAYISVASDGQTWASNDCPARLVFATTADGSGTPSERMRIDSSGKLLVGLSSSLANGTLQVAGDIGLSGNTKIRQATNSDGNTLQLYATQVVVGSTNGESYGYSGGGLLASLGNTDGQTIFDAGRYTSTSGRVKVVNTTAGNAALSVEKNGVYTLYATTTGNVGIGTSSPSIVTPYASVVDIRGTSADQNYGGAIRLASNNGTTTNSYMYVATTGLFIYNTLAHPINFGTNNTERMRIDSSGGVSIGSTSSPGAGNLLVNGGTITTGSTTALSLATSGGTQAQFLNAASAVNYLQFSGSGAGADVYLQPNGSDTNIGLYVGSKGTDSVFLHTGGTSFTTQVVITHTASANRYITMTGSNGGDPTIGTSAGNLAVSSGLQISKTSVTAPASTDGNVFSGTYTPTLTNTTNITASTAYVCQYMRVGNVVTVSGKVDIDPTTVGSGGANIVLDISLPIASAMTASQQLSGMAIAKNVGTVGSNSGPVYAETTNDLARFDATVFDAGNISYYFNFTYQIL